MSEGDPFFGLPTELCCAVLRDWLLLDSVVRLDSAVCRTVTRALLLNTIFVSPQCVLSQGSSYHFYQRENFEWLHLRKLRVVGLHFTWDVDDKVWEYLLSYGESIKKISFSRCNMGTYLPLISAHCNSILCLSFVEVMHNFSVQDIALFSRNLKALDMTETLITDDNLKQILKQCPALTHISVAACSSLYEDVGRMLGRHLKHLRFLDISNTALWDNALVTIANNHYTTLEELHMEYCDGVNGSDINVLLQKCTKLWSLHTTYHDTYFKDFDFSLLCNLTELSIIDLNETESYLHSVVQHSKRLKRFRLNFQDSPPRARNSKWFSITQLNVQRMPELKVFAPFGMLEKDVKRFSLLRPEVEIVSAHDLFSPSLFEMKW